MNTTFRAAVSSEWFKLSRRRFCWISIAMTSIVGFVGSVAPKIEEKITSVQQQIAGNGAGVAAQNSFVYLSTGLKGVAILAGLFVALAASNAIAGEASGGMLRISLARPISRSKYFLAKFVTLIFFLELLFVAGAAAAAGGAALAADFGAAVKILVKSTFGELATKTAFALALSQLALAAVLGFSLCASTLSKNAAAANSITIGFLVLSSLAVLVIESAKSYVFSAYATSPFDTLRAHALGQDAPQPVWFGIPTLQDWADITFAWLLPASCAAAFVLIGMRIFSKKDWLA
ncbi:MAG: ABC transporter permease subunit [Planctomycetota bacterium]